MRPLGAMATTADRTSRHSSASRAGRNEKRLLGYWKPRWRLGLASASKSDRNKRMDGTSYGRNDSVREIANRSVGVKIAKWQAVNIGWHAHASPCRLVMPCETRHGRVTRARSLDHCTIHTPTPAMAS